MGRSWFSASLGKSIRQKRIPTGIKKSASPDIDGIVVEVELVISRMMSDLMGRSRLSRPPPSGAGFLTNTVERK